MRSLSVVARELSLIPLLVVAACAPIQVDDAGEPGVEDELITPSGFKDVARVDPSLPACTTSFSVANGCYNAPNPPAPSITRALSNPLYKPVSSTSEYGLSLIETEDDPVAKALPRVLPFEQVTLDGRLAIIRQDKVGGNNVGYLSALRPEALDADLKLKPGEAQFQSKQTEAAPMGALLLLNPVKTMVPELYRSSLDFPGDTVDSETISKEGFLGSVDLCESTSDEYTLPAERTRSPRHCTSEDAAPVEARCYNLTLLRNLTNNLTHKLPNDGSKREKWGFHELRSVEVMVAVSGMTVKIYPRKLRDGRDLWTTATFPRFTQYEYAFPAFVEEDIGKLNERFVAGAGSPALGSAVQPSDVCYARSTTGTSTNHALNPFSRKACDFWENQSYSSGFRIRRTHADRNNLATYVGLLPGGSAPEIGPYPVSGLPSVTATWDGRKRSLEEKQGNEWKSVGDLPGFTLNQVRTDQVITAKDGRLAFLRFNGLFYAYAPAPKPACRASSFGVWKPLSGMPSDVSVNQRYALARTGTDPVTQKPRNFRNTQGQPIAFGQEDFADYAWVDPEATNIFFTAHNGPANNDSFFATEFDSPDHEPKNVKLPSSFNPQSNELFPEKLWPLVPHDKSATQTVVLGAWTHHKWVVLDNMLNAADFAGRNPRRASYRLRLYADRDLTISPGDNQEFLSVANAGFLFAGQRPTLPFDVVWKFGTSSQHDAEVAFDPYLLNDMMIVAHMNAPLRSSDSGFVDAIPDNGFVKSSSEVWQWKGYPKLQNAATGKLASEDAALVPGFLELLGGARVEPVAQGGVLGKGVFLDGHNDRIQAMFVNVVARRSFYLGLWIDWRTTRTGPVVEELVYALPNQRSVHLARATSASGTRTFLVLRDQADPLATTVGPDGALPGANAIDLGNVSPGTYFHLGLVIDATSAIVPPGAQRIVAYVNGTERGSLVIFPSGPQLALMSNATTPSPRVLRVGATPPAGGADRNALRAWVDELWVMSLDGALKPSTPALRELICNAALGTLKVQSAGSGALVCEQLRFSSSTGPGDLPSQPARTCVDVVHRNPHAGTAALCRRAALLELPTLQAGSPRPDTTNNAFCLACHSDTNPTLGLQRSGPLSGNGPVLYEDGRRQPLNPPAVWSGPRLAPWQGAPYAVPLDVAATNPPSASTIDQVWTSSGFVE